MAVLSPFALARRYVGLVCAALVLSACPDSKGISVTPTTPVDPVLSVSFIRFVTQPGTVVAGQALSVSVELVASNGSRVTTANTPVSLSINGTAVLSGTTTVNASSGLATFTGVSLSKAGVGFQLTATNGSFTATSNTFSITAGPVSSANSIVSPTSFTANVATTLTFTFRDQFGNPTPSATVSLSTTAAGSTFTPASGTTGADGTFVTSFKTSTGGSVPIAATAGGVTVTLLTSVTSTLGTVNVNFKDAGGTLIPGVTYTVNFTGGSAQFVSTTGADVVTNVPAGAVSVVGTKVGFTSGSASGTVVSGGTLTLNATMAVAGNACTPLALAFPGSVSGTLSASSCLEGTQPTQWYQFSVGGSQGVQFTVVPTTFASLIAVTQNPPTQFIQFTNSTGVTSAGQWLLPTGTYRMKVASTSGTGSYSLTGASSAGLLTTTTAGGVTGTCPVSAALLVPMTVVGQTLSTTDCKLSDDSFYDVMLVFSSNPCTITMRSTSFDAWLDIRDRSTGASVRFDDNSGGGTDAQVTLTACNNNGNILEIRANSFFGNVTGPYSLTLAITGAATNADVRTLELDPRLAGPNLRSGDEPVIVKTHGASGGASARVP